MSPATGVQEEDNDQTGDSGMGTGSGSVMTDFLPGIYEGVQLYKHHSRLDVQWVPVNIIPTVHPKNIII